MARMIDLAHEFGFHIAAFHHAAEAYKIAPLLVANEICIAGWPDWWSFKPEAEDSIRENIAFVDAAGGCVMVHSDIPILGEHLNLEAAKAAAAGRRAGLKLPPEHVIEWLTSNPAKALALGGQIGRLVPGFDADVVLWSGDPFSIYSKPEKVFVDGALMFDSSAPGERDFRTSNRDHRRNGVDDDERSSGRGRDDPRRQWPDRIRPIARNCSSWRTAHRGRSRDRHAHVGGRSYTDWTRRSGRHRRGTSRLRELRSARSRLRRGLWL
jgi:hypothetical protein